MAYIGAEPVPGQNREVDDISSGFNGNATAFTLQVSSVNVSPESANNILINLGGVLQNPGTDYTIAASTITFTTAPAAGLSFFGLILGAGINTATVADQTIGTSKVLDNAITADKLAHTSVTAGSYTTADITVDAQGRITAAASGSISNAEIANNAVTTAKIADSTGASDGVTTAKLATDAVTAAKLANNAVVNASVDASAAIAGTKISPDFGSQAISTTGGLSINGATVFNESGADVDFRIEGDTQASLFKVDAGNDRIGVGEGTPTVVFHATQFGHAFADSTSNLATVPTKSVARFRGSNNASGSLFIGNESTNARCYLQGCNETGNGSIDLLLNPFGANVGINTVSPDSNYKLDLNGSLRLGDGNAGRRIQFSRSGLGDELVIGVDGTGVGSANDAVIQSSPSFGRPLIFGTNNNERLRIDSSGRVLIGMTSGAGAQLQVDDGIQVYSTATNGNLNCGTMDFTGDNFRLMAHNSSAGCTLSFLLNESSGVGVSEKGRFNPNGHFLVGTTSDTTGGTAATEGVAIRKEGHVVSRGTSSSGAKFTAKTTDTGGSLAFRVMLAQTEIGSISMGSGGTAFNTSSDYRRKENVVDLTNAITRLKTLLPKRFNFIGDSSVTRDGFLAHEVTAVPEAIYGTKDQVDSDNNPVYQQIDQSKLVPLLTAALQEAITKIETLETKVAALEAA